jgi:hypothetical protein
LRLRLRLLRLRLRPCPAAATAATLCDSCLRPAPATRACDSAPATPPCDCDCDSLRRCAASCASCAATRRPRVLARARTAAVDAAEVDHAHGGCWPLSRCAACAERQRVRAPARAPRLVDYAGAEAARGNKSGGRSRSLLVRVSVLARRQARARPQRGRQRIPRRRFELGGPGRSAPAPTTGAESPEPRTGCAIRENRIERERDAQESITRERRPRPRPCKVQGRLSAREPCKPSQQCAIYQIESITKEIRTPSSSTEHGAGQASRWSARRALQPCSTSRQRDAPRAGLARCSLAQAA